MEARQQGNNVRAIVFPPSYPSIGLLPLTDIDLIVGRTTVSLQAIQETCGRRKKELSVGLGKLWPVL